MQGADVCVSVEGDVPQCERRFVAAPHLMLEAHDDTYAVIVNTASCARLKVSASVYALLTRFDVPRTIGDVFGSPHDIRAFSRIQALLERRLLVDADDMPSIALPSRRATPYRFCNAPAYSTTVGTDIVVLGIPYDLGGPGNVREGPLAIRQKSLDFTYLVGFDTRRPEGWFDAQHSERILKGVTIADADDLNITYGEAQSAVFGRLLDTLGEVLPAHGVPLILGGDRSIAFAVAAYFAKVKPLTVVQLAAETTAAERTGDMVTIHDVGRAMMALEGVVSVATLGLLHHSASTPVLEVTADALRDSGRFDLGRDLVMAEQVLLSIDMGVVDACMPPSGEGLSLREVHEVIEALGQHRRLAGLLVVGLDPAGVAGNLCATVACHIALRAMHVATRAQANPS